MNMTPPSCDDKPMWDLLTSLYHFPTVLVADELGLFAYLAQHPATVTETATHLHLSERAATALLGTITALNLLQQYQGRFHLTEVARTYLHPDSPYYWGGLLNYERSLGLRDISAEIREALLTNKPFSYEGQDLWAANQANDDMARGFTEAMHISSMPAALGLARLVDLSGINHLLDVGGGSGCYAMAIATRYPAMRLTVMELPALCPITQSYLSRYGFSDQIDTLGLDMFHDPWPTGYEAMFFSQIFHDWDIPRCRQLAEYCFAALPVGGQILLHEMLLHDTLDSPLTVATFSTVMMIATEGQQFSAPQLVALLDEVGFHDITVQPTYGYYALIRGRK